MAHSFDELPVVMILSGLDPTGGAGLQADIESLVSMGCHPAPVATAIVVQDTHDVARVDPLPEDLILEQARAVIEDMQVAAVKFGLLPSREAVEAAHTILTQLGDIPVVLDPVLNSGGGTPLVEEEVVDSMISLLFPRTTVVTPNTREAHKLAREADTLSAAAQELLSYGCDFVLLTGTHDNTPEVINTLYTDMRRVESFYWERLPDEFHGSGCTLASAIAGLLAQGSEVHSAVREAQAYAWTSLRHSRALGRGQRIPDRLHWARDQDQE